MRFAITGDTHLHSYTGPQVRTLADGTNSRLRDILDTLSWVADEAIQRGCSAVLHAGDLFHNRKSMANEAWTRAGQAMRAMNQRIPTYVLVGNHDMAASGDGTSTVEAIDGLIHAVTTPGVVEVDDFPIGWLPYVEDPEEVRQRMTALRAGGARIVIGHLGIGDPKLSRCIPTDYEVPGRINVSDLQADGFAQVFLGHYHTAQDVAPNARYVGSPLQLTYKEAGEPKGFWVYDTVSDECEFVENQRSPQFRVMTAAAAFAQIAHGEVPGHDFVWVKDATRQEVQELREVESASGRLVGLRIDLAPVSTAPVARITDAARTEDAVLDEYVRASAPGTDDDERAALVRLGKTLVDLAGVSNG